MNEKVAPVVFDRNGNPKPPSPDVLSKAREHVEESGANSEERFNRVVLGETTFREQAKTHPHWIQPRDRGSSKRTGLGTWNFMTRSNAL
jgi:hypothetical protein